jgi:hypothetical protein
MRKLPAIALAAWIATLLPVGTPNAQAKQQCSAAAPSNPHGRWWSYRLIDGRKCWYEGKTMVAKSSLQWAVKSPERQQNPAVPTTLLTEKRNAGPLESRASIPDKSDSFESLWRARAIKD